MKNRVITILGKKGSGKTCLALFLISKMGGDILSFSPVQKLDLHEQVHESELESLFEREKFRAQILSSSVDTLDEAIKRSYLRKNVLIFVDEYNLFSSSKEISRLCHIGRHYGISLIICTRRYADIPRLITASSDEIYIFGTSEPVDLQYVRKMTSEEDRVKNLTEYSFLCYNGVDSYTSKLKIT